MYAPTKSGETGPSCTAEGRLMRKPTQTYAVIAVMLLCGGYWAWENFGPAGAGWMLAFTLLVAILWAKLVRPQLTRTQNAGVTLLFFCIMGPLAVFAGSWALVGPWNAAAAMLAAAVAVAAWWRHFMKGHLDFERKRQAGMRALDEGFYDKAEPLLLEALDKARKLERRREGPVGVVLYNLAKLYAHLRDYSASESYAIQALEVLEAPGNPMQRLVSRVYELTVAVQLGQGSYQKADESIQSAVKFLVRKYGDTSGEVGHKQWLFARLLFDHSRYLASIPLFQAALKSYTALEGPEGGHVGELAVELGNAQRKAGDCADAIETMRRALERQESISGPAATEIVPVLSMLGAAYSGCGYFPTAVECHRRALHISERLLPSDHPATGQSLYHLAAALNRLRRFDDAERSARRAVDILRSSPNADFCASMQVLAEIKADRGQDQEADRLYHAALTMLEQQVGETHLDVADNLDKHAAIVWKLGRMAEAEQMMARAQEIRKRLCPEEVSIMG